MLRKFITTLLLAGLVLTGTWYVTGRLYEESSAAVERLYIAGDWPGAMAALENYKKQALAVPVLKWQRLKIFALRLSYLEGVVTAKLAGDGNAVEALREAANSPEKRAVVDSTNATRRPR